MTTLDDRYASVTANLDAVSEVLSHLTRRGVLLALREEDPRTVAEFGAAPITSGSPSGRHLLVGLLQLHLPRLAKIGLIDWDRRLETLTKGPRFGEIRPRLEWLTDSADDLS